MMSSLYHSPPNLTKASALSTTFKKQPTRRGQELKKSRLSRRGEEKKIKKGVRALSWTHMAVEPDKFHTIYFEETELRLGLPGGKAGNNEQENPKGISGKGSISNYGKRGFPDTVDLKLNLSSKDPKAAEEVQKMKEKAVVVLSNTDPAKPPAKAQVVGWPPVRSFRKNVVAVQKASINESDKAGSGVAFVKVSMDGAPYLRKVDLKLYKSYQELSDALANMFRPFTIGNCGSQGTSKDFMNESKLIDLLNGSDYVPTYEDKDGDWMLVGDVPWEMFVDSCKRLRIMKGSEAIGLAPRAVEKCRKRG